MFSKLLSVPSTFLRQYVTDSKLETVYYTNLANAVSKCHPRVHCQYVIDSQVRSCVLQNQVNAVPKLMPPFQ